MTTTTHVTDDAGFLAAICADPDDDVSRFVYADWLEENGQGERAELIRVQMEIARLDMSNGQLPMGVGRERLFHRGRELLKPNNIAVWAGHALDALIREHNANHILWPERSSPVRFLFRRGFVEMVECETSDWLTHGPAIVRAVPICKVTLSDKSPNEVLDNLHVWYRDDVAVVTQNSYLPVEAILPVCLWRYLPTALPGEIAVHIHEQNNPMGHLSMACIRWARGPHEGMEALPKWEPKI